MNFPDPIKDYIKEKIGDAYYDAFKLWSIVGPLALSDKFKTCETFVDAWNLSHPSAIISRKKNAFDAVDRMIEIWKDRFG
jgi:hypothetical protein